MPTGTVTFLFTDIEGSTKLWEQHPQAMRDALAHHDDLMHQSIAAQDGIVFKTIGDAFCAGNDIEHWEVLDLLTGLVDKSLVIAEAHTETTRYRFLETVRQHARDRLAEGPEGITKRGRHRDYSLQWAEGGRPKLIGPEQAHWYPLLETEHENLRPAITLCLEQSEAVEPDMAAKWLRLGSALWRFWETRGHLSEGMDWLTALLMRSEAQEQIKVRADALSDSGNMARMQGDYALAYFLLAESLALIQETWNKQCIAVSLFACAALEVKEERAERPVQMQRAGRSPTPWRNDLP